MKRTGCFALLLICLFGAGVPTLAGESATVFVSILPQKFFVQQISGDLLNVEVMVPPGASPHTYEPKPSQMRKMAASRAYFTIGVALEEAWLDRITRINPEMMVVHTEAGLDRMAMSRVHRHENEQSGKDEHHHEQDEQITGGLDPHIWLSPILVKHQAEVIRASLEALDPENKAAYKANFQRFVDRIDKLDGQLKDILEGKKGMKFMVFHPSWGYFARSYDLVQVPVEIEGKSPKPAHLKGLIELARREKITVIFAQPQFSRKSAEVIAREIGAQVVLIDPLGENWFENMMVVADKLSAALR